jgi:hypothetical protein
MNAFVFLRVVLTILHYALSFALRLAIGLLEIIAWSVGAIGRPTLSTLAVRSELAQTAIRRRPRAY